MSYAAFHLSLLSHRTVDPAVYTRWAIMDEHVIHQTEHMTTIEASAVSQQVHQVHLQTELLTSGNLVG